MKNNRITGIERLLHILDSISSIESFLAGYDKSSFLEDRKTIDATLFNLPLLERQSSGLIRKSLINMTSPGIKSEPSGISYFMNIML